MVVLGIDPSTRISGFVIFKKEDRQLHVLDHGTLCLSATMPLTERVAAFYAFFKQKIETFCVSDIALETPFLGKSPANFLKLGYLRGAVYILTAQYTLVLHEYAPRQVKASITGFGGADKEQVARMVLKLFPALAGFSSYDLTDAFAVGICCIWSLSAPRGR